MVNQPKRRCLQADQSPADERRRAGRACTAICSGRRRLSKRRRRKCCSRSARHPKRHPRRTQLPDVPLSLRRCSQVRAHPNALRVFVFLTVLMPAVTKGASRPRSWDPAECELAGSHAVSVASSHFFGNSRCLWRDSAACHRRRRLWIGHRRGVERGGD